MENWEKINAVQRMQDFIEAKLNEPISLYMLAQVAGYSPWHTSRIFKQLTGKSPLEYIQALRLSRAAVKLWNPATRIIDIALDFAFDSHEGFTRAFSEKFGVTPRHYRRTVPPIPLFMPSPIRSYYLMIAKGEIEMTANPSLTTVFVQVVERPARKLILKRAVKAEDYFEYCEEIGCDVWGILCSTKEALYEPIGMWLSQTFRLPGTAKYAMGVEVPLNYGGQVPEGFDCIDLPACKVMVFQGPPFDNEQFETAIYDLWEVMKKYNPEFYGFKWADEDGPRFQLEPQGERGYIEARPVRSL